MPAQTYKRRAGLKSKPPRQAVPLPGEGGYDYPAGPYGATGFPGSTAAARKTKRQTAEGRRDRQLTATQIRARDTGPELDGIEPWVVPKPQPRHGDAEFRPGSQPDPGNTYHRTNGSPRLPRARTGEETATEHRMTPVIGAYTAGPKYVRNDYAQRWKADPRKWRDYKPAANPGKTGARLNGMSEHHPGQMVWGDPDGKPIPGMPSNLEGPSVTVQSRFFSDEGAQEGYAMNRRPAFDHGGIAAFGPGYGDVGPDGDAGGVRHIRGGRLSGQRYFGALEQQQQIGLPSDSYGIKRRRGPNHRPIRFEQPAPWSANYYDVPPEQGTQSPDMIHRGPASGRGHGRGRGRVRRG